MIGKPIIGSGDCPFTARRAAGPKCFRGATDCHSLNPQSPFERSDGDWAFRLHRRLPLCKPIGRSHVST